MTEIQQGGGSETKNVVSTSETAAAVVVGSKRQRRPSVRLGDIGGDPPYDSFTLISSNNNNNNNNNSNLNSNSRIRTSKHQNPSNNNNTQFSNNLTKPSKIKPLTNLTVPQTLQQQQQQQQHNDYDNDSNVDRVVVGGGWRPKDTKKQRGGGGAKRVRSNNWVGGRGGGDDDDDEIENEGYGRGEFHIKNSESPMTPLHSSDNVEREEEDDLGYRHNFNTRSMSNNNNEEGGRREDGVTIWLRSLGLGRYAPVFEIHEVDDEVLPLLTLEDLKDMGINAVGSRRKMFCAIQKLSKGFS